MIYNIRGFSDLYLTSMMTIIQIILIIILNSFLTYFYNFVIFLSLKFFQQITKLYNHHIMNLIENIIYIIGPIFYKNLYYFIYLLGQMNTSAHFFKKIPLKFTTTANY